MIKETANFTNREKTILLIENLSTCILLGGIYLLARLGCSLLEIIEVQSSSYLGEDDIVRFENNYGSQE